MKLPAPIAVNAGAGIDALLAIGHEKTEWLRARRPAKAHLALREKLIANQKPLRAWPLHVRSGKHRGCISPRTSFMAKIDGSRRVGPTKGAARPPTKPRFSSFIRAELRICDQCPIRIFVRSRGAMAGAWSVASGGPQIEFYNGRWTRASNVALA